MKPWPFQRVYVIPGRRICGLLIIHDPAHKIGDKLSKILYGKKMYLLSIQTTFRDYAEEDLAIIDMTNSTMDVERLKDEVSKIEGIRSVERVDPVDEGVFVDYKHHPLTFLGGRGLMLREPAISLMVGKGYERFGEPFSIWLYYAGVDAGRAYYKSHISILRKPDREKVLKLSRYMFQLVGFGLLEHVKVEDDEAVLRVRGSIEVEVNKGSGRDCQFIRGMFDGWFSEFFGKEVEVTETKCASKGDEYCEFSVKVKA